MNYNLEQALVRMVNQATKTLEEAEKYLRGKRQTT